MMKTVRITFLGAPFELCFERNRYKTTGSLCIRSYMVEDGAVTEPFSTVTRNFIPLRPNLAYVDLSFGGKNVIEALEKEGYAKREDSLIDSGGYEFPLYSFTDRFLSEVCLGEA